jgi:hypothetical protein
MAVRQSALPSFLTLEESATSLSLHFQGKHLVDGDLIPHWHQGQDLEFEFVHRFNPEDVVDQAKLEATNLMLLVTATSSTTKRSQFYFFDVDPSGETWGDLNLDGSQMGGTIIVRADLCPNFESKKLSPLAADMLNPISSVEIPIRLEGSGSRVQVETFDFDGTRDYPKNAYWRIETSFPEDALQLNEQELNSSIWVSINALRETEIAEPVARALLKAEFQIRILTEALSIPGAITYSFSEFGEGEASSLVQAIRTVVSTYFDQWDEHSVQLAWRTQESAIRSRVQGASS